MTSRITRALIALGMGILTGATLAVLVFEDRFSALSDMIWRFGWILRGRPMAPSEVDGGWLLEIEMKIAFESALVIAIVGSMAWAVVTRRGHQGYRSAASIGFILAAIMAAIWLHGEETAHAIILAALMGLSGAIAGSITYAIGLGLKTTFLRRT